MNDAKSDPLPHIAGYDISRRLGRGGMADVYLAVQASLARPVAIKVLAVERTLAEAIDGQARPPGEDFEETVTRFEREARTIARLDHPHIVSIFDVGRTDDGRLYYVMPYLPNGDLSTRDLREDEAAIVSVVRALCRALGYAHTLGVVHRDVKPENVLFDKLDRPLLADFGIALAAHQSARVTREGSTMGSSGYMSPEQARGHAIDGRADLYSLGVVTYEMLSGDLPFHGPDALAVALAHVEQPVPRLRSARRHWQEFIDRAMAKSPAERFQTAA
ncbi:MAG TPA: serine/threonine-protein kinase, partial [Rhodanobacteraceae bacterium]|nr:serine/threonine-protein kinase [Rhodanobacteraceae bacterium]